MKELEYPLDSLYLLKKRRSLTKQLKAEAEGFPTVKIAVLGGSTTAEVVAMLEMFLLNLGISPVFYQSEYQQFWADVMFSNEKLHSFSPDLIYVHTTVRNIQTFPSVFVSEEEREDIFRETQQYFTSFWDKIQKDFSCPVIQNNFELPPERILGNQDAVFGKSVFIHRMNHCVSQYAGRHSGFYVQDLQYLSADFGLRGWHDRKAWHMYKYALSLEAIPHLAYNLSKMIASLYGKRKKTLVLDLDNTLWGGVVGDDGIEQLKLGQETGEGETFLSFQSYVKQLQETGVLLAIASKNELENALSGLNHPDSLLSPEDFLSIKANWKSKEENLREIAQDLNLGLDSLVFVDDNPAERALVEEHLPDVAVVDTDYDFISYLDHSGYFEVTTLTAEDKERQQMYQGNQKRANLWKEVKVTGNYQDYLISLEMTGICTDFQPMDFSRIAQLTNKTNQFNLTTKRYTRENIEEMAEDEAYITLSGRLQDKFGDNGLVSVILGKVENQTLVLDLWLMSCRVLQRDFEMAMLDALVEKAKKRGITHLTGCYLPTAKNKMVAEFYETMGFSLLQTLPEGGTLWSLAIDSYITKNKVISREESE